MGSDGKIKILTIWALQARQLVKHTVVYTGPTIMQLKSHLEG